VSAKLDTLEAEREAERVVADHPFTQLPICPFAIAEKAGIVVHAKDSTARGVSGFLMRVGDTFGIQYATHIANEGFIRFTVAHELGHYFLPGHPAKLFPNGDGLHQSRSGFISGDPLERQADHFASALLMPEKLFKQAVRRSGQGFSAIEKLVAECRTSITATAIRFAKFSDNAVAVIVSSGNQIDYCFMSDYLRDVRGLQWIKKGDALPSASVTAAFNRDPANVKEARAQEGTCCLDDWFDGGPQVEMNEDVIGLGSYGKTLTVLFTDEALDDDDDYDDDDDD
jgi:Zn-dependent peptidase ImmA (M78 family)